MGRTDACENLAMTSNQQQLNSEKSPSGLPRWATIGWFIVFPLAFLLIARFIYEQTYLTWANGLQMVGFTLAHQGLGFLIPGMLALGLTHVWLLIVVVLVIVSRRYRRLTAFQAVISSVTILSLVLTYIPYLWWQEIVVRIPGSKISQQDIFLQAAGEGRVGTVKSYLPPNADLKTINRAFFSACVGGQTETMKLLLQNGADVNCIGDELGETPLMAAAQMGHEEALKMLLEQGAYPNIKQKEGKTALSIALEYQQPAIAALLQQNGAKASVLDAASSGDIESVRTRLSSDSQTLSLRDATGYSSLYHAAEAGHSEVAAVLLAAGADPNDFTGNNGWGYSPLLIAARNGHADVVELLLEHGADANAKSQSEDNALCLAASNGHLKVAAALLAHGADVNKKGGSLAGAPLDEAAYSGDKAMVELLIAHKADLNVRDQYGFTPLHMAAYHGHADIVDILLAAGAEINAKDKDGNTPLWQAKSRGQNDTANLLRQHGAKENAFLAVKLDFRRFFGAETQAGAGTGLWEIKSVTGIASRRTKS
jgi:ankyrin repeat protein